jgi:RNA polymerase sigma factor (sigma-70 family)
MALGTLINVLPRLRDVNYQTQSAASDAELLERFIADRDEIAFEVLVRRHGPMVFAVCQRVLHHTQDAEDAFQATFLVLAHKASSISPRSKLAGWLHGVAHRTSLKARYRAIHRSEVEKRVPTRSPDDMHSDMISTEVEAMLDQEIASLPDRYRLPIILCDLEGRLRTEVASVLRCSEGTLSSRLTRGRRMLAERLNRRGIGPTAGAVTLVLTARSTVLAESLILDTVPVVLASLANPAGISSAASPNVAQLATGVMKGMFLNKLRAAAIGALAIAAVSFAALVSYPNHAPSAHAATGQVAAKVSQADSKTTPDAATEVDGHLLLNRKVLKDMKCDIDQLDKIMDALEDADQKSQQKIDEVMQQGFRNANGPQGFQKAMQDAQEAGAKEFKKAVDNVMSKYLSAPQKTRLKEIDLQARGYEAFQLPVVAKALDLAPKQKEELEKIATQVKDEIAKAMPQFGFGAVGGAGAVPRRPGAGGVPGGAGGGGGGGAVGAGGRPGAAGGAGGGFGGGPGFAGGGFGGINVAQYEKAVEEARDKGMKQSLAVLTDDQKTSWKKLTGEPITYQIKHLNQGTGGFRFGTGGGFGGGGFGGGVGGGVLPGGGFPVVPPPVDPTKPKE